MASPNNEPMLPKVEESDLLGLVVEEVIDPKHVAWWKEFAKENPSLARQVIKRAYFDTQNSDTLSSFELQKIIVDSVSFAVRALRSAAERQRSEANVSPFADEAYDFSAGDDGGGDRPLSA